MPHLSTFNSQQLMRITATEFSSPNPPDKNFRYAVSDTPLPDDRISYWAATIKVSAWSVVIGVIADKTIDHNSENFYFEHPTFFAIAVFHNGNLAWMYKNGQRSDQDLMASVADDVLLFRFDPRQHHLTVINSRTKNSVQITEMITPSPTQPFFITLGMRADSSVGPSCQIELRQLMDSEFAFFQ
jgi:hypothetical protein